MELCPKCQRPVGKNNFIIHEAQCKGSRSQDSIQVLNARAQDIQQPIPFKMKFVSWNCDGLMDQFVELRSSMIAELILKLSPQVILLQEVTLESSRIFLTAKEGVIGEKSEADSEGVIGERG